MDKTNKLLLELVRTWGADLVTARLHHFKRFRNLDAYTVAEWALGERTPSEAEIIHLKDSLPRIAEQMRKKRPPKLASPEDG